jgi:hypothetical protein
MWAPSAAEIVADGDGDVESAPEAELEADGDPEADVELETDGDTDPEGDTEADAESEADAEAEAETDAESDGDADPELDPEGEGLAVLVPAVPDEEGVGEVLAEADGDGDGEVVCEGDGDGEAEDGNAWQVVSVFGVEVGVCEAGEEVGDELGVGEAGDEVVLDVPATGLSEPARAMAGHASRTAAISKPPASKLSVLALTCVNRI